MISLNEVKNKITSKFDLTEKKWLFFSGFDENLKLLFSKWTIVSGKNLSNLLDDFFYNFVRNNKKVKVLIVDVVKNIVQLNSVEDILNTNIKENWLAIITNDLKQIWVILPDTKDVPDVKKAISLIKEKNKFSNSNVVVYRFNTERFVFS